MITKRLIYIFIGIIAVVGLFKYLDNETKCEDCGGCAYDVIEDTVMISYIEVVKDSFDIMHLQSVVDTQNVYEYRSPDYRTMLGHQKSSRDFYDTTQKHVIFGGRLIKGSCEPYFINSIKPVIQLP